MREYHPKRPLERLTRIDPHHYWRYPNLLRDESGRIISDNIAYIKSEETNPEQRVAELTATIKECCPLAELVYHDMSGNRWIFLLCTDRLTTKALDQMQQAYEQSVQFVRNPKSP